MSPIYVRLAQAAEQTIAGITIDLPELLERLLGFVGLIVFGLILYTVGRTVIRRVALPKYPFPAGVAARASTTRSLLMSAWRYAVTLFVLAAMLSMVRPSMFGALAVTGVVGLVLALAAQTVFKDVLAGFSILLEGQFAVGDRVRLFGPDVEGVVEGVGLRITVLREEDGSRLFVPNGAITAVRTMPPGTADDSGRGSRGGRGGRTRTPRTGPRQGGERGGRRDQSERRAPSPPPLSGDPSSDALSPPDDSDEQGESQRTSSARRRSRRGGRRRRPAGERSAAEESGRQEGVSDEGQESEPSGAGRSQRSAAPSDPAPERGSDEQRDSSTEREPRSDRGARPDRERTESSAPPEFAPPKADPEEISESPWSIE